MKQPMKQSLLFSSDEAAKDDKYSKKIQAPIYEPRHEKPPLLMLCDTSKTKSLIREIDNTDLPEDEKAFLRTAAWRHAVFNYERIADYYAHATPQMQRLMEQSALVIIDFDAAIEHGFVKLCDEIRSQFLTEYDDDAFTP